MGFTVQVPMDTKHPGVVTEVRQTLDLKTLDDNQFKRVRNAAMRGVVNGRSGYVAQVLTQLAKRNHILPPFTFSPGEGRSMSVYLRHPVFHDPAYAQDIEELIKISDARHRLAVAQMSSESHSARWRDRKSSLSHYGLELMGWRNAEAALRKELDKRFMQTRKFKEHMAKLVMLVDEKPTITLATREF